MLLLAAVVIGGANFLMNQSRGQQVVNHAKQLQIALDQYLWRNRSVAGAPGPTSPVAVAAGDEAAFNTVMKMFLDGGSTQFLNPYKGSVYFVEPFIRNGVAAYPNNGPHNMRSPSTGPGSLYEDPSFKPIYGGQVLYAAVQRPTYATMDIYDGTVVKAYSTYAVQALDLNCQPLLTVGR